MGLFNFFDVTREGPGVSKTTAQRTGVGHFFELYFRKFWKLVQANLLYVLVSLPIVTRGLAQVGLTYITRSVSREKHSFIGTDFKQTVQKNWKQGLAVGLINLVVTAVLWLDLILIAGVGYSTEEGGWVVRGLMGNTVLDALFWAIIFFLLVIFTIMKYYLYFMVVTFRFSLKQLYKNSRILAGIGYRRNLPVFLVLLVCYAAGLALLWFFGYFGLILDLILYVFWFPAFRSYLIQYNIFPVIRQHLIDPYYKEHPGADLLEKQALNLEYEQDGEREEAVFEDTGRTERPKKNDRPIPRQYSRDEIRRGSRPSASSDDDETI